MNNICEILSFFTATVQHSTFKQNKFNNKFGGMFMKIYQNLLKKKFYDQQLTAQHGIFRCYLQ